MPHEPHSSSRRHLRLVLDEHERERSGLAEELHEQVAQELAAALFGLDDLASRGLAGESASRLASVREQVADALEHCRALAVALHPPLLDQFGLASALERLASRVGVERVSADPALTRAALGPALEAEIYRCVERLLARTGAISNLAVSLDPAGDDVLVSAGPCDRRAPAGGLEALEARLELLGGTLTASGGQLLMRIPVEREGDRSIAAFPQPHRVDIPDGEPRALP